MSLKPYSECSFDKKTTNELSLSTILLARLPNNGVLRCFVDYDIIQRHVVLSQQNIVKVQRIGASFVNSTEMVWNHSSQF